MQLEPGGIYRVGLDLSAPDALHPAWLAGAVGITYPGAEVVGVKRVNPKHADVTVRWSRANPGKINEGDNVVPLSEGLQMIPGGQMPQASVANVTPISQSPVEARSLTDEAPQIWKLALSCAMIGLAAYAAHRMKRKHAKSG